MKEFPQELVNQICSSLQRDDLRSVFFVSTKFRKAAEQYDLRCRCETATLAQEDDPETFVQRYSGPLCHLLRDVEFKVHFGVLKISSEYDTGAPEGYAWCAQEREMNEEADLEEACIERLEEKHEKDVAFTQQIHWIFDTLKRVEDQSRSHSRGTIRLTINVLPYYDDYCWHRGHAQWRTALLDAETLPDLKSIISLHLVNDQCGVKLNYHTQFELAKRLPNLEYLSCSMGQDEWTPFHSRPPASWLKYDYDGPRRDARHDLTKAVSASTIPANLKEVDLNFISDLRSADQIHQWKTMPDLVYPYLKDPFSNNLRILSYPLKRMVIRAQVDETLFWPDDSTTPHWPHLEFFHLMFHMASPSGAWYFEGPCGEGRDSVGHEVNDLSYPSAEAQIAAEDVESDGDWDCREIHRSFENGDGFSFRISPDEKILGPFLIAYANATHHMPKLKQAILWSPLAWEIDSEEEEVRSLIEDFDPPRKFGDKFAWGIVYEAPGLPPSSSFGPVSDHKNRDARQIWWKIGKWRPGQDLHRAMQGIGQSYHGVDLCEYWNDDEAEQGFEWREAFEWFTPEEMDFKEQNEKIESSLRKA